MKILYVLLLSLITSITYAEEVHICEIPEALRFSYRNYGSGSCVYMSIGINGIHRGNLNAASCPWDSPYGNDNVGGASPSDVARMSRERDLPVYNVTANNYENMKEWFIWSAKTNRFCALGFGGGHFQTLYGYDAQKEKWYVVNNNSPRTIDEYTEREFKRLHEASGYWAVFLIGPAVPAIPKYITWYK